MFKEEKTAVKELNRKLVVTSRDIDNLESTPKALQSNHHDEELFRLKELKNALEVVLENF